MSDENAVVSGVDARENTGLSKSTFRFLVVAFLIALILRIYHLGAHSLGPSEATLMLVANHGSTRPVLSPILLILTRAWMRIGLAGSAWTLRLIPLGFGLGAVIGGYGLGKTLFNARAGAAAAFLLAVSPAFVARSQVLSPAPLEDCATVCCLLFLARTREANRWREWLAYVAAATIAMYVSPLAAVVLAAVNLWYFVSYVDLKIAGPWVISNGLVAALYLPYARELVNAKPWRGMASATDTATAVYTRFIDFASAGFAPPAALHHAAGGLLTLVVLAGIAAQFLRRGWRVAMAPVLASGIPLVVALWMLTLRAPVNASVLLPLALPLLVCAGVAIAQPQGVRTRAILVALIAGLYGALYVHARFSTVVVQQDAGVEPGYDYRAASEYISHQFKNGDLIAHSDGSTIAPMIYYGADTETLSGALVTCAWNTSRDPVIAKLDTLGSSYRGPRRLMEIESTARPHPRVWLVFSAADRRRLGERPRDVKAWLDTHLFELDHQVFTGVELFLYERKIDGHWTRVEGRDADDGVSADLTYWFGEEKRYTQVRADTGVVPLREEERRGRLRLQFDERPIPDHFVPLVHGASTREQGFSIINRSSQSVRARLRVAATARLVEIAGMTAHDPASPIWRITDLSNDTPPPRVWPLPSMAARVSSNSGKDSVLNGGIHLEAGDYFLYLYQFTTAQPVNVDRAIVAVVVGDRLSYRSPANFPRESGGWTWTFAGVYGLKLKDDLVHVNVAATLPGLATAGETECAYLAFIPRFSDSPTEQAKSSFWEGNIEIGPGESSHWSVSMNECMDRCDVWALETDGVGQAYRIFRMMN